MFKVNNRNTITRCEICSKLTIKTPERQQWRRSGVFIVNFEHISQLVLVFLLLTMNRQMPAGPQLSGNTQLFKVNNWNYRKSCKMRSKLIIQTPLELHQWRHSGFFIVKLHFISHLSLLFLLLILNR